MVFAEQGYQNATVREISSRVGANLAAVNYHYGDKLGLYNAVLRRSLMAEEDEHIRQEVAGAPTPEQALRIFVARMLAKCVQRSEGAFQFRIMAQEMANPTPALAQVVEEVIQPKFAQLRNVIARILHIPADHPTTRMCAHSLIGQIMHYANSQPVILLLSPGWDLVCHLDAIADHIYFFTLHGLMGMAEPESSPEVTHK